MCYLFIKCCCKHRHCRKMTPSMFKFVLVVLCVCGVLATDDYITESQEQCKAKSDLFSCGKYEAAKFISKATNGEPTTKTNIIDGVVDFVTLEQPEPTETLFPAARQMPKDSEIRKFAKFVQRQVDAYLGSRAISISLPGQTRIVDADEPNNEIVSDSEGKVESRGKKKKASMLIPLILLLKLFKVKIMLALVLGGVLFIKKAIMFALILAPSYLQMLKICKVQHHPHIEEHDFGSTGYGYAHSPPHGHHTSYAKDWAASRAYSAYKPT